MPLVLFAAQSNAILTLAPLGSSGGKLVGLAGGWGRGALAAGGEELLG